ncbi:retrovirus-related pol polyprotein from transposon TNT 1-94 [Tanacetum coccineum]
MIIMKNFLKSDIVWERRKEILASPHPRKTTPLVQSCQRDPEALALSLINQDLLLIEERKFLGPEKIVFVTSQVSITIIFNDVLISKQRLPDWGYIQVIKTYWETGAMNTIHHRDIWQKGEGKPDYAETDTSDSKASTAERKNISFVDRPLKGDKTDSTLLLDPKKLIHKSIDETKKQPPPRRNISSQPWSNVNFVKNTIAYQWKVCLKTCLEPNEWIKDSGCSKHMTSNKSLFSTYKAYDGVEESLNVTFDESPPPTKLSPLIDDDVGEEEAIRKNTKIINTNNEENKSIEVDEIINVKESKNHPLDQVIGNLNQRTLRSQAQNHTNDVWELVPLPISQSVIETKWVFRNKLDENGIVSRNKARLVAQRYNQQEGIDYDETYAPVARLESIRILLAIAYANDFKLYQMDVKSAFLNGFINKEVYVAQPPGLEDSKPTKTPMSTEIKLTKDDEADSVDSSKYRENPKTTHLEAVKRIFRYIRGTSHLGLWYPKGTGIETVVYADSDHAGDYVDRKSTSGVCTFMGCCLTSWFAKKQTALAISTTEAEYVFVGKACQQALWMKQALIDYGIRRDDVLIIVHRTRQMDEELRESYRTLEKRLFHEGRTVTPSFISENNMLPFFQAVGLEPFLTLNEPICPRFVVEFYHSLEVKRDEELRPYIEFKLGQFTFKLTPS